MCSPFGEGTNATGQPMPVFEPAVQIKVTQDDGRVVFEFSVEKDPRKGNFIPAQAATVMVKRLGSQGALWEIGTVSGEGANKVTYGIVPQGFEQYWPAAGLAPNLERGTDYIVSAQAGSFGAVRFRYTGKPFATLTAPESQISN